MSGANGKAPWRLKLATWLLRTLPDHGVYRTSRLRAALADAEGLEAFCARSGFLRDGRYPGGRPAERKVKGYVDDLVTNLKTAPVGATEDL